MKKIFTQSLIVAICLLTGLLAQAQNKVTGITITPDQVGNVTYGSVLSATYTVTLTKEDGLGNGTTNLTVNWLGTTPSGVSISPLFSTPVSLPDGNTTQDVTLTITSDATTDAGSYSFTVSSTNDVFTSVASSFLVDQAVLTVTTVGIDKIYDGTNAAT